MKDYLSKFPPAKVGIYATVIVIFTYNILLERDVACTCKQQTAECTSYMVLPCFIIFLLILWMDTKFQRTWRYTCTRRCWSSESNPESMCTQCCCSIFLWVLVRNVIKAALVGLLWVASVYIDGEWYVCCKSYQSEQQAQLPCKDKTNLTAEEQTTIAEMKNWSKVVGFSVLLGIIAVAALMSLFGWRKCCEGKSTCCDRKVIYAELILEKEGRVLRDSLKEAAKEKLTEYIQDKIQRRQWADCFDAAERLIESSILTQDASPPAGPTAVAQGQNSVSSPVEGGHQGEVADPSERIPLMRFLSHEQTDTEVHDEAAGPSDKITDEEEEDRSADSSPFLPSDQDPGDKP